LDGLIFLFQINVFFLQMVIFIFESLQLIL